MKRLISNRFTYGITYGIIFTTTNHSYTNSKFRGYDYECCNLL